jgi:hypothetical protein
LNSNEPGVIHLIREASKAFAQCGDEKNGALMPFQTFIHESLSTNRLRSVPLERFKGNRFNIIFSSAGNVFFLANEMLAFLQAEATNRLLKSLSFDLQVQEYLAGRKALGLISELISKPLWCRIEDPRISIMQIGPHYKELVLYLENIDFIKFMEGNNIMPDCDKEQLQHSVVFMSLIKPREHDCKGQVILELIIQAVLSVIKRILADHLDGGNGIQ